MEPEIAETRHEIHELVEKLPESELQPALRMMQFLLVHPRCLAPDDEPVTEEEEAAIRASEESIRRGEPLIPHEEVLKEYGL